MNKELITIASVLSLFGCGGGGSPGEPTSSAVLPVVSSSADFVSDSTNLHRYDDGEYIAYEGRLKLRESSVFEGFDQELGVKEQYQYSQSPLSVDAIPSETMTNVMSIATQSGDAISDRYEYWQGEASEGFSPAFRVFQRGEFGACALYRDKTCFGVIKIPTPIQIGISAEQAGFEGAWDSLLDNYWQDYEVTYSAQYTAKENVTTQLGVFEAYKLTFSYQRDSLISRSETGAYWIYPGIGIIKAEYERKESEGEVYDITYSITDTNIAY